MPNEQKNLSKKSFKKETKKALFNILETEDFYTKPDEIMVKFKHGKIEKIELAVVQYLWCTQILGICFSLKPPKRHLICRKNLKKVRYNRENVLGNLYRRAKGVIIRKASSRVLTFSVGFCPGSQFAYIVSITSCTVHSLGIFSTFCKMLNNKSLHQMV